MPRFNDSDNPITDDDLEAFQWWMDKRVEKAIEKDRDYREAQEAKEKHDAKLDA